MNRRILQSTVVGMVLAGAAWAVLLGAPRARARPRPAARRAARAPRPQPARRVQFRQTRRENISGARTTRRENISGARTTRRENVSGARTTRRENVSGARTTRRENVSDARTTRRENIAEWRATLPPVTPVTVTTEGVIEIAPIEIVTPPPAEPAPAPAEPVPAPPVAVPPAEPPARAAPAPPPPEANEELDDPFGGSKSYKVLRIEDEGTTVVIQVDQAESKVRMIGVAPMSLKAGRDVPLFIALRRRLPSTTTFLQMLLKGESVYVLYDSRIAEQDKDGKYVGYVYRAPDGLLMNQEVIRNGFAAADTRYTYDLRDAFLSYQKKAQTAEKGIFGMLKALAARRAMRERN
jgi:endonuclease YncB( thermonuclease family)